MKKAARKRAMKKAAITPAPMKAMKKAVAMKAMQKAAMNRAPTPRAKYTMVKTGGALETLSIPTAACKNLWCFYTGKWFKWNSRRYGWENKREVWQRALESGFPPTALQKYPGNAEDDGYEDSETECSEHST